MFTGEERRVKGGREKEKVRKGKRSEEGREGEENRGKERICSLSGFRSSMGF